MPVIPRFLAASLADDLARLRMREAERNETLPSFREFLESEDYAAPYMRAVGVPPVIGAIVDASEGSPVDGLTDDECRTVFRLGRDELPLGPQQAPRVVVVNAGRQCGKTSNLLAPKCVHAALTQPAPFLRPGQVARAVIISPTTELSEQAFNCCRGIVQTSPRIQRQVEKINSEQILLRRTDGHFVEIVVGAADKGGTAARSKTLLFCGLDEVAFFKAADGYTINDRDLFDAAMGALRTIEGAQCWMVSTSWIEGKGIMEEFIHDHWGRPGSVLVAARLSTYVMRGIVDDGCLRQDTDDEDSYNREVLALPMPPTAAGFFPQGALEVALGKQPPPGAPDETGAGGDFAFERDAAAIALVGRWRTGIFAPTRIEERKATPHNVTAATRTVRELGGIVASAGVHQVMADHHRRGFVTEHLHAAGVAFLDAPGGEDGKAETYSALKRLLVEERFALGALPQAMAKYIVDQLASIVAIPLSGGRFKIAAPRTKRTLEGAGGARVGSHGDAVSALVLAAWQAGAGRWAQSWQQPRTPATARPTVPLASRLGAGSSMDWLRARSSSSGAGRALPGRGRPTDDD